VAQLSTPTRLSDGLRTSRSVWSAARSPPLSDAHHTHEPTKIFARRADTTRARDVLEGFMLLDFAGSKFIFALDSNEPELRSKKKVALREGLMA